MVHKSCKNYFTHPTTLYNPKHLFLARKKVYNQRGICTKIPYIIIVYMQVATKCNICIHASLQTSP